jgi:hypothetical protein
MRRARIVRIEWSPRIGEAEPTLEDIEAAFKFHLDRRVTVTGEPSFTVKESDE